MSATQIQYIYMYIWVFIPVYYLHTCVHVCLGEPYFIRLLHLKKNVVPPAVSLFRLHRLLTRILCANTHFRHITFSKKDKEFAKIQSASSTSSKLAIFFFSQFVNHMGYIWVTHWLFLRKNQFIIKIKKNLRTDIVGFMSRRWPKFCKIFYYNLYKH